MPLCMHQQKEEFKWLFVSQLHTTHLIHFVRHEEQLLLPAQLDDVGEVLLRHHLPCGVARVDDGKSLWV